MTNTIGLPVCTASVLAVLEESRGIRFTCGQIGKRFKRHASDVRPYLIELEDSEKIRAAVVSKNRMYWAPSQAELDAENRDRAPVAFKPLVGYGEMMRAAMNKRG